MFSTCLDNSLKFVFWERVKLHLFSHLQNAFNLVWSKTRTNAKFFCLTLSNDKILAWSKQKAITDSKLKLVQMTKFVLGRVEIFVGKGENCGYLHFLTFSQFLKCLLPYGPKQFGLCNEGLTLS